jgi:hypothetical protein
MLVAILIALGLLALHFLASWAEDRGWIYYRRRQGGSGALGNAVLEVQAMLEPSTRHVVEERQEHPGEGEESGDPPPNP